LVTLLNQELPDAATTALASLLERARRKTVRVWAQRAPFEPAGNFEAS
jgi:DNA polymerase III subunit epsilon